MRYNYIEVYYTVFLVNNYNDPTGLYTGTGWCCC